MRSIVASCSLMLVAATVVPARADVCPTISSDRAAADVRSAFDAWNQAVMQKDLDRTMAIFSPSIRFQFQGAADFGYPRLLKIYTASFSRENAPQWHPIVEKLIASPDMVTLFSEWKLLPAGGGDPISEYRGVDVFQRESDCVWRVTASLNYADKSVVAANPHPEPHSVGPATVDANKAGPLIAGRATQERDLDLAFGNR